MNIALESIVLAIIGIADLVTTVLWVRYQGAQEANPVFAHYLALGICWFVLMKLILLFAPIFLLEWARPRRPVFTRRASRLAIAAYLILYGVGFVRLNPYPSRLCRGRPALRSETGRVRSPDRLVLY